MLGKVYYVSLGEEHSGQGRPSLGYQGINNKAVFMEHGGEQEWDHMDFINPVEFNVTQKGFVT